MISDGIEQILRKPGLLLGLAVIPTFAAQALALLVARLLGPAVSTEILVTIVELAGVCAATVLVTRTVLALAEGQPMALGEAFASIGAATFRMAGTSIVLGFVILLGLLLLLVPGILLAAAWAVTIPAAIIEDLGPASAARRSASLTRGHRREMLTLIMLTQIVVLATSAAIGVMALLPFIGAVLLGILPSAEDYPTLNNVFTAVGYALSAIMNGTIGVLAWRRLIQIKGEPIPFQTPSPPAMPS